MVATAAVSDFRPAAAAEHKVKKDAASLVLELERNPDILAGLGERKDGRLLVGFAAETTGVLDAAREKLVAKHLDLVVANDVSVDGLGFGSDRNQVWFVTSNATEQVPEQGKRGIARLLWDRIAEQAREASRR